MAWTDLLALPMWGGGFTLSVSRLSIHIYAYVYVYIYVCIYIYIYIYITTDTGYAVVSKDPLLVHG